jgi:phosphotransferase system  glucose/maltose/N-acetylglucosamine-specific IIC component
MIRELNIALQVFRDVALICVLSLVLTSSFNFVLDEPVARFLFSMCAFFILTSIINLYLIYTKTEKKIYFYINTFLQLLPSSYVSMVIPIGIVFFVLNFIILTTLVIITVKERRSRRQSELETRKPKIKQS